MIEIALCLAIIGFALVAIIGVLPTGMQVQKDNREETIINQDATYLVEAIRGGARGLDDLTNYVSAITNRVTLYNAAGTVQSTAINGYTRNTPFPLLSGERIIGLLSTPKYQYFNNGFVSSNYVTAYLRAISGSAVEKATNADARAFAFGYRVTPEIIPYTFYDRSATNYTDKTLKPPDVVARSNFWQYAKNQQTNLFELRFLFRWPLQPNGNVGNGRQVFRTTVSSQITPTSTGAPPTTLFFFQPRSYVRVP
jgi:type II secretory pathway pseudopilin PulG